MNATFLFYLILVWAGLCGVAFLGSLVMGWPFDGVRVRGKR